jgi:hypothetical protein
MHEQLGFSPVRGNPDGTQTLDLTQIEPLAVVKWNVITRFVHALGDLVHDHLHGNTR